MAHKVAGNKLVSAAVAGTIGVAGTIAVYVPFIADRDKLRGLHEESAPPTSAMLAEEIKKLQQEGILRKDDDETRISNLSAPVTSRTITSSNAQENERKSAAPGSMWKYFSK